MRIKRIVDSWDLRAATCVRINEHAARLVVSNWQRRLWTLRESMPAKILYIHAKLFEIRISRPTNLQIRYDCGQLELADFHPALRRNPLCRRASRLL